VEAYDTTTNTWTTVASMPTARTNLPAVTGPDGRIYAIGGFDGSTIVNTVEAYTAPPASVDAQFDSLVQQVRGYHLHRGIENSLIKKLLNARADFDAGDLADACSLVASFINEGQARTGGELSSAQAAQLISQAQSVQAAMHC
jgi:hypothetical protein